MTSGLIVELNPASLPSVTMPPSGPPAGTSPTSQAPRTTTSAIREDRRAPIVADEYMQDSTPLRGDAPARIFGELPRTGGEPRPRPEVGRPRRPGRRMDHPTRLV